MNLQVVFYFCITIVTLSMMSVGNCDVLHKELIKDNNETNIDTGGGFVNTNFGKTVGDIFCSFCGEMNSTCVQQWCTRGVEAHLLIK